MRFPPLRFPFKKCAPNAAYILMECRLKDILSGGSFIHGFHYTVMGFFRLYPLTVTGPCAETVLFSPGSRVI